MKREDVEKLLGGYATGTLTPEEREALFAAAMDDQKLFDALAREEPLRELLSDPAARAEVAAALEEREPWWKRVAMGRMPRLAWASAAALLVVGGFFAWRAAHPARPVEVAEITTETRPQPAPGPPPAPAQPAMGPLTNSPAPKAVGGDVVAAERASANKIQLAARAASTGALATGTVDSLSHARRDAPAMLGGTNTSALSFEAPQVETKEKQARQALLAQQGKDAAEMKAVREAGQAPLPAPAAQSASVNGRDQAELIRIAPQAPALVGGQTQAAPATRTAPQGQVAVQAQQVQVTAEAPQFQQTPADKKTQQAQQGSQTASSLNGPLPQQTQTVEVTGSQAVGGLDSATSNVTVGQAAAAPPPAPAANPIYGGATLAGGISGALSKDARAAAGVQWTVLRRKADGFLEAVPEGELRAGDTVVLRLTAKRKGTVSVRGLMPSTAIEADVPLDTPALPAAAKGTKKLTLRFEPEGSPAVLTSITLVFR